MEKKKERRWMVQPESGEAAEVAVRCRTALLVSMRTRKRKHGWLLS